MSLVARASSPDSVADLRPGDADPVLELLQRSGAMRKRLLLLALVAGLLGAAGLMWLYAATADTVYGRVLGAAFAVGGIASFAACRAIGAAVARAHAERVATELAASHGVDRAALVEAAGILG
jgi:hypothetical protein